jgi:uncharacterized protein YggT (Ycf19 family)
MNPIIHLFGFTVKLVTTLLNVVQIMLFIYVVMNLLVQFGFISLRDERLRRMNDFLFRFFDPILRRIRPKLPYTGAFDLSVLALFIGLAVLQNLIVWLYAFTL